MARYEVRNHSIDATKSVETVHTDFDKAKVIAWANEKTKETGDLFDVVEIKHIHITTNAKEDDFAFF